MYAFTIEIPIVIRKHEKTWKIHGFSREYHLRRHRKHSQWSGNIVWDISDEKYFHRFSNSYFELYFLHDFIKKSNDFHKFCLYYHPVAAQKHQVCFKKNMQISMKLSKNIIQNRSWKIEENIFHEKCPKQHSLTTESVSGDVWDDISSKTHKKFMLFHVCWLL